MSNSIFTARGQQAKESAEKGKVDLKKALWRMKSGDSHKVRILSENDYVEYLAHSSFANKIYTQSCAGVMGQECALCTASKSGIEAFSDLYTRKRYLFVFADLDTKDLRAIEVSKNQAKKLIVDIEEYKDNIDNIAFNLKKIGEGTNTSYSLSPILSLKGADQDNFNSCAELEVTDEYLNTVLAPRTMNMQVTVLHEAGFPTDEYFPEIELIDGKNTESTTDGALDTF